MNDNLISIEKKLTEISTEIKLWKKDYDELVKYTHENIHELRNFLQKNNILYRLGVVEKSKGSFNKLVVVIVTGSIAFVTGIVTHIIKTIIQ